MKKQEKKMINSILFFANKSHNHTINRLKLMKLLWLADRIHLNRYGRTILRDQYYAMPHGPVPSKTMDISEEQHDNIFDVENYEITAEDKFDPKCFSQSDLDILEEVWDVYGNLNQYQLEDFSHLFPEWERFKDELNNPKESYSFPMKMVDFFDKPKDADFPVNEEMSELAKEVYFSHKSIQDFLTT